MCCLVEKEEEEREATAGRRKDAALGGATRPGYLHASRQQRGGKAGAGACAVWADRIHYGRQMTAGE